MNNQKYCSVHARLIVGGVTLYDVPSELLKELYFLLLLSPKQPQIKGVQP